MFRLMDSVFDYWTFTRHFLWRVYPPFLLRSERWSRERIRPSLIVIDQKAYPTVCSSQFRGGFPGRCVRAHSKITSHFRRWYILPNCVMKTRNMPNIPAFPRLVRRAPQYLKLRTYFFVNPKYPLKEAGIYIFWTLNLLSIFQTQLMLRTEEY